MSRLASDNLAAHQASRDSEHQHQHFHGQLEQNCQAQANMSGLKSAGATAVAAVAADFVLQRSSQSYRANVGLTGKVLGASLLAYSAFYISSFAAERNCVNRMHIPVPKQGVTMRDLDRQDKAAFIRPATTSMYEKGPSERR